MSLKSHEGYNKLTPAQKDTIERNTGTAEISETGMKAIERLAEFLKDGLDAKAIVKKAESAMQGLGEGYSVNSLVSMSLNAIGGFLESRASHHEGKHKKALAREAKMKKGYLERASEGIDKMTRALQSKIAKLEGIARKLNIDIVGNKKEGWLKKLISLAKEALDRRAKEYKTKPALEAGRHFARAEKLKGWANQLRKLSADMSQGKGGEANIGAKSLEYAGQKETAVEKLNTLDTASLVSLIEAAAAELSGRGASGTAGAKLDLAELLKSY